VFLLKNIDVFNSASLEVPLNKVLI